MKWGPILQAVGTTVNAIGAGAQYAAQQRDFRTAMGAAADRFAGLGGAEMNQFAELLRTNPRAALMMSQAFGGIEKMYLEAKKQSAFQSVKQAVGLDPSAAGGAPQPMSEPDLMRRVAASAETPEAMEYGMRIADAVAMPEPGEPGGPPVDQGQYDDSYAAALEAYRRTGDISEFHKIAKRRPQYTSLGAGGQIVRVDPDTGETTVVASRAGEAPASKPRNPSQLAGDEASQISMLVADINAAIEQGIPMEEIERQLSERGVALPPPSRVEWASKTLKLKSASPFESNAIYIHPQLQMYLQKKYPGSQLGAPAASPGVPSWLEHGEQ